MAEKNILESTTRIADLPDSTYEIEEMPRFPKPNVAAHQQPQDPQYQLPHHQRLPARDIPMDSTYYTQDVQIQPNYIPAANVSSDYIRDKEVLTNQKLKQFEDRKSRLDKIDMIMTEMHTPLIIMLLFFLFQLPIVNTMVFKKFSFLSLFSEDGNFNTTGIVCKSILFGIAYYSITKSINVLIDI